MRKKIEVEINGEKKELSVVSPTRNHEEKAKIVSNKVFRDCVKSGSFFRSELNAILRERGILTAEEEKTLTEATEFLENGKKKLKTGGIELEEAKKLAIEMRKKRFEIIAITVKLNEHDAMTVEGQTDNAYFDALVSLCVLDENGKPVFSSYEDYLEKSKEDYASTAAKTLSSIIYGTNDNWEKELPENKFLIKYKFVDDKLRLVNKDGKYVDSENRLINEDGRYINDAGEYVNRDGERVDENGDLIVEEKPFLNNGDPV